MACKCGCGQRVKIGNVYIHNHHRRGSHHSDATKRRMGSAISRALAGRRYEDLHGAEKAGLIKDMRAALLKERWEVDTVFKWNMSNNIGAKNPYYGRKHSLVTRQKMSRSHMGVPLSEKCRKSMSRSRLGKPLSNEHVKAIIRGNKVRPNKIELRLLAILGPKWRFVGDGQLVIGGKCPDFWDGRRKLIEFYGEYWHSPGDEEERISHFNAYGYECRIIWQRELETMVGANGRSGGS